MTVSTAGRPAAEPDAPLNPPVVLASTFRAGGRLEYARETAPTTEAFEQVIGALEGGRAVAFGSGEALDAVTVRPHGHDLGSPGGVDGGVQQRLQVGPGTGDEDDDAQWGVHGGQGYWACAAGRCVT